MLINSILSQFTLLLLLWIIWNGPKWLILIWGGNEFDVLRGIWNLCYYTCLVAEKIHSWAELIRCFIYLFVSILWYQIAKSLIFLLHLILLDQKESYIPSVFWISANVFLNIYLDIRFVVIIIYVYNILYCFLRDFSVVARLFIWNLRNPNTGSMGYSVRI